jgi:DNA-binding CsgD family transcriptional regulator
MNAPQPQTPAVARPGWSVASFRASLVPMVIANDEREYVAANLAMCLLLRLPEDEVLGRTIDELTPPQNRAQVLPMWEAFLRDGTQRGTFELLMPDRATVTVEYSATANIEPGRHLSILMFPAGGMEGRGDVQSTRTLLTPREREVLGLVAMGMSSSWIAAALSVSASTVETHVRNCLDKLGARNRAHAIALGVHVGEIAIDFTGS